MRKSHYFFIIGLLLAGRATAAETGIDIASCNGQAPAKPGFELQPLKIELDSTAVTLMAKWKEDSRTLGPVAAAENHNERVAQVYDNLLVERKNIYAGARCEVYSVKKCANGVAGKKKKCPMKVDAPEGAWFNSGLTWIDNDFQKVPTIASDKRSVSYTVKKTGKGANTAGFRAPVTFLPSVIDHYVDADFAQVHAYFSPLVRINGHTGD